MQTLHDIKYFMYVMVQLMFMFGSGLYLIQINRITEPLYGKEPVYTYENHASLLEATIRNQYKLILGDFDNMSFVSSKEGYGGFFDNETSRWISLENLLVLLYFVGSTFFTQIVILNMLIAIMSATFDRHNEDL